jgi:hypothetical protein
MDGALGVILVRNRRPKERHDAVAEELVHRPLVAMHLRQHQLKGPIHQAVNLFRIEPLRERGEP